MVHVRTIVELEQMNVQLIHGLHSCLQVLDFSENLTTFSSFRLHSFRGRLSFESGEFKKKSQKRSKKD